MEDGRIVTDPRELYAVITIFDEYISGKSLMQIADMMMKEKIPYHPFEDNKWNRNMVKRILENHNYIGTDKYPQIVDKKKFHKANDLKTKRAVNLCIVPENMKDIRNATICSECRKRMFRNQDGTWMCKTIGCVGIAHNVTDQMIISAVLNCLNSAIANPDLLNAGNELSIYRPNGYVTRQRHEIDRLCDSSSSDYDRIKSEIIKLAEIKYNCCSYDDIKGKTKYLKEILEEHKQLDSLDIELLNECVSHIVISSYASISIEMINGVNLYNSTERKESDTYESNNNTCE